MTTPAPTTTTSTLDWRHWALTHALYLVLIGAGIIGFYSWKGEHDARLIAEAKVKADESQVIALQQNISQNNAAIASLQQQMEARDAAAQKQIATLAALVSKVQTPAQAVAALPQVSQLPTAPTVQSDSSVVFPSQDVLPLFQQLAQGKQDGVNLAVCTADLKDEKTVDATDKATIADMTKQLALKDDEIKALKKPKGFWKRAGGIAKAVGVGIGIGLLLGHHI
jgi:hypothetical protein